MIRQAISCDICGTEKRQTNHWFVAYEQGGELRMSGWSSRLRLRPGSKHLCGQTCLHKLVDEYMAKSLAVRAQRGDEDEPALPVATDTSLTSRAAYDDAPSRQAVLDEDESSVRLWTFPMSRATTLPTGAPRPGNASGSASCAQPSAGPILHGGDRSNKAAAY